ncbi:rab GTPase-activating protein 1-like [Archocentrus centrarchus]|uniref:rab GTPase-activating protein 1-like n=1 Tax=Archocentrus centrarchus TaxID=63155 RepID=UPI0011EA0A9D|nr:rab GTPase-activating protein 1-like [Archocentrus centrarchus]
MMEEVSAVTAYDAHTIGQMSEEEILASLVAETEPKFTVPTKEAKLKECRLQIMDDEEDTLDKYVKGNRQLQQASLRLEQENDNLAHKLIASKVALRRDLDKAEDTVGELTKDLVQTRQQLQATEYEKRGKEEEAAMLKEVFRREMEKAEQKLKRSSGIIADYKQICSQLTNRLERQQAAHREEMDSLKSAIKACSHCQHTVKSDEPFDIGENSETEEQTDHQRISEQGREEKAEGSRMEEQKRREQEKEVLRAQIRELEQELVQTKLQMVETTCKIQDLEHQKGILADDLQEAKNSWISKTFTSLRTSSGGLHSLNIHKDGAHTVGWNLHKASLSGWSPKKLSWPHRGNRENV